MPPCSAPLAPGPLPACDMARIQRAGGGPAGTGARALSQHSQRQERLEHACRSDLRNCFKALEECPRGEPIDYLLIQ